MSAPDPDVEAHLARWVEFKQLAVEFEAQFVGREDWAIVLRFYAALHLVDAYVRVRDPNHMPGSHSEREGALSGASGLATQARRAYFRLKGLSRDVRYVPAFRARPQDRAQVRSDVAAIVFEVKKTLEAAGYHVPLPCRRPGARRRRRPATSATAVGHTWHGAASGIRRHFPATKERTPGSAPGPTRASRAGRAPCT